MSPESPGSYDGDHETYRKHQHLQFSGQCCSIATIGIQTSQIHRAYFCVRLEVGEARNTRVVGEIIRSVATGCAFGYCENRCVS